MTTPTAPGPTNLDCGQLQADELCVLRALLSQSVEEMSAGAPVEGLTATVAAAILQRGAVLTQLKGQTGSLMRHRTALQPPSEGDGPMLQTAADLRVGPRQTSGRRARTVRGLHAVST